MSDTERRYAQIEEALACTWACEKFSSYILGMKFLIEMDHKPLVPLHAWSETAGQSTTQSLEVSFTPGQI